MSVDVVERRLADTAPPARSPARPTRGAWLPLCLSLPLAALITGTGVWRSPGGGLNLSLFDDAMISMSYGRTLARTGELVWFPGAPRTEGITNLGWTLVMALLHRLGLSASLVAFAVIILGLLAIWATAVVGGHLAVTLAGADDAGTTFIATAAVATCFPLLWWTLRGMEVGIVTLLTVVAITAALSLARGQELRVWPAIALTVAIGAGIVVRTDFAVAAGAICLWLLTAPRLPRRWFTFGLVVAVTAAVAAGCVAFRIWYYGDPFPNTYYLKLAGVPLGARLDRGSWATALTLVGYFIGPTLIVVLGGRRWLSPSGRQAARLVALVAGSGALYSIYVGGDAWEYFLLPNRYLTPGLVLMLVLAVAVLRTPAARGDTASPLGGARSSLAAGVVLAGAGPAILFLAASSLARPNMAIAAGTDRTLWLTAAAPVFVGGVVLAFVLYGRWSRDGNRSGGLHSVLVGCLGVSLAAGFVAVPSFTLDSVDDSGLHAYFGAQVEHVTRPDAVVAFAAAGGPQYFSDRPAVDLLGKSDEVVAKADPANPAITWPGHDKHDYEHSIGHLRPDVVAHLSADLLPARLLTWGYRPYRLAGEASFNQSASGACGGEDVIWVLPDSQNIRWERLEGVDPSTCR